jgi:hypothetical protein
MKGEVSEMKVSLTAKDVKALLQRAKEAGTLEAWSVLAVEWMEAADARIRDLEQEIEDLQSASTTPQKEGL